MSAGEKHMRNNVVVDTGVLGLFFGQDPRLRGYLAAFEGEGTRGYIAGVNLAEFYHKTCRTLGRQTADARFHILLNGDLDVVEDTELDRAAGVEKCGNPHGLSLADCYTLALSKRVNGLLLTTDENLAKSRGVKTQHFPV